MVNGGKRGLTGTISDMD